VARVVKKAVVVRLVEEALVVRVVAAAVNTILLDPFGGDSDGGGGSKQTFPSVRPPCSGWHQCLGKGRAGEREGGGREVCV
jgi:hypothetical protein